MKYSFAWLLYQTLLFSQNVWANAEPQYESNIASSFVRIRSVDNVLESRAHKVIPPHVRKMRTDADIAHGVLMGCAVALFLPLGALTARLIRNKYMLRIHVLCQTFGLIVFIGGFATGVWTCINHDEIFTDPHTSYGTAIVAFFLIQPVFGWLHHAFYAKKGRTIWTHVHVWFGRAILILAIVNGGLGIKYAENAEKAEIGFGVVSAVVGIFYIGVVVWWYLRGEKTEQQDVQREESYGSDKLETDQSFVDRHIDEK